MGSSGRALHGINSAWAGLEGPMQITRMLACLGISSESLQVDWSLDIFCGIYLLQREQPKKSRVCCVAFSDTGSEPRWCSGFKREWNSTLPFGRGYKGPLQKSMWDGR